MLEIFNTPEARAMAAKRKQKALLSIAKLKPKDKPWANVNGLDYLTAKTIEILTQRTMEWFDEYPYGEACPCPAEDYQVVIWSNQVASFLNKDIRIARRILAVNRIFLIKPANYHITINEFCWLHKYHEDEMRIALKKIKPDLSIN